MGLKLTPVVALWPAQAAGVPVSALDLQLQVLHLQARVAVVLRAGPASGFASCHQSLC